MKISIVGLRSKRHKRIMKRAAEYYGSLLMTKRIANLVNIEIVFKSRLEEEAEGFCQFIDSGIGYRDFEIELLRGLPLRETLINLAHEMVHLKQFATGELSNNIVPAHLTKWQGKDVNEDLVNYWDLPWEIEAHGREKGLYYRFADKYGFD